MKKIIMCFCLLFLLFGCYKPKEAIIKPYEEMVEAMRINDSFKVQVNEMYTLPKESTRNNIYFAKINDFYNKEQRIGEFYFESSDDFNDKTTVYIQNNEVRINNEVLPVNIGYDLFYGNLEFLNVDFEKGIFHEMLYNIENKNLLLQLEFSNKKKQKHYFGGNNLRNEEQKLIEGSIDIKLNDDYTINRCEFYYEFKEGTLVTYKNATLIFSEYGHQDIDNILSLPSLYLTDSI